MFVGYFDPVIMVFFDTSNYLRLQGTFFQIEWVFFGYFDPTDVLCDNENKQFSG